MLPVSRDLVVVDEMVTQVVVGSEGSGGSGCECVCGGGKAAAADGRAAAHVVGRAGVVVTCGWAGRRGGVID
jgi:hypothetical protein